jgi:pimeloyl-ACP methyl ester carboxylesterase
MSTILLIPEPGTDPDSMKPLHDELYANGHDLIRVALPVHCEGKSLTLNDLVCGVHHIIDTLDPDSPPVLIGHGMGGLIAQIVASQRVTGPVVLLNSMAPAGISHLHFQMTSASLRRFLSPVFRHRPAVKASRISAPIFIISGARDTVIPPKVALELNGLYSQADYESIDDLGHEVFNEPGAGRIIRDITGWIEAMVNKWAVFPLSESKIVIHERRTHHDVPAFGSIDSGSVPDHDPAHPRFSVRRRESSALNAHRDSKAS